MEFQYRDGQNQRIPSPAPCHPSTIVYVSGCPLQGCEFMPGGFPGSVPMPRVFPMPVPVNSDEVFQQELEREQIQQELEREEIRREIFASDMALARRRELEEEVRREMAMERGLGILVQRPEGILFQRVSSFNPRINNWSVNHNNMSGGLQLQLPPQANIRQPFTRSHTIANKDNVITLAKSDADHYGAKRKADDNEHPPCNLQKRSKQDWSCTLCQITTTSEKGLNDHLQGKKHKAKEASLSTQKIGLDSRPDR